MCEAPLSRNAVSTVPGTSLLSPVSSAFARALQSLLLNGRLSMLLCIAEPYSLALMLKADSKVLRLSLSAVNPHIIPADRAAVAVSIHKVMASNDFLTG